MYRNKTNIMLDEMRKNGIAFISLITIAFLVSIMGAWRATWWGEAIECVGANQIDKCWPLFLGISGFLTVEACVTVIEGKCIGRAFDKTFLSIREKCFERILNADLHTLEKSYGKGNLIARVTSETDQLNELFTSNFTWFARTILLGVISVGMCLRVSWQLSILFFVLIPIFLKLSDGISSKIKKQRICVADSQGEALGVVVGFVEGVDTIKGCHAESFIERKYEELLEQSTANNKETEMINAKLIVVKYLISILQLAVLFGLGYFFIRTGIVSIGNYVTFVLLSENVRSLMELSPLILADIHEGKALASRISEIFELPAEELREKNESACENASQKENIIELKNLTFYYDEGKNILNNVSMKIPRGSRVGIIGESGSGKSTILKILCGFYHMEQGEFFWNGQPFDELDLLSIRKKIAYVPQEPFLFEGTIFENVCCGKTGVSEEQVKNVLKQVKLWEEVRSLPDGINTVVGIEKNRLSGGQIQRIAIARALLKEADLFVLDEITSALDQKTEMEIQKVLEHTLKEKTVVIVSHRLQDIKNADYIYCIEKGTVREEGTPEALNRKKGYFYKMMTRQQLVEECDGTEL